MTCKPSQTGWIERQRSEQLRSADLPAEADTPQCVVEGQPTRRQGKPQEPLVPTPETWVNEVWSSLLPGHQLPSSWGFTPVGLRGRTASVTSRPGATAAAGRCRPGPSLLPASRVTRLPHTQSGLGTVTVHPGTLAHLASPASSAQRNCSDNFFCSGVFPDTCQHLAETQPGLGSQAEHENTEGIMERAIRRTMASVQREPS